MNDNIMIETKNITKAFGDILAVNDISLEIKKGEFVSLLGPSGCGKTTLLRMIGGMETPTKGDIYLQGSKINNIKAHRRPINMVFQRYALFPHLNVFNNIAFGPRIKKVPKAEVNKRIAEMLKLVQLEGFENRMSSELSGGECQRVALARALINDPLVLLLDEPLGALDLKLRKEMQVELRNIQQKLGGTFMYVTHDQEEALVLSDRIMVMNEGKIVQTGTPIEIYRNPNTIFSSKFIGESNLIEGRVEEISKQNDTILIKSANKKISAYFREDVKVGSRLWVSVRFESINLSKDKIADMENTFPATVKSFIFLGPVVKYDLEVEGISGNLSSISHVSNGSSDKYFKIGEKVNIGWDKYSCSLLFR